MDFADGWRHELLDLLTEPTKWYASHPNWPSAMTVTGPPLEMSLRLDWSRSPSLRFVADVTDHRFGLVENWPRYLRYCAAVIGGEQADTLAWRLCRMHLDGVPSQYRSRMLHGIGYGSGPSRRGTVYFRNRMPLTGAPPHPEEAPFLEELVIDARAAGSTQAELLGYDFSNGEVTRSKMFCPLTRAQSSALVESIDRDDPRLGAARVVADTFGPQARDASLFTALQISAQNGTVGRKLYFPCAPWQWSSAQGFLDLVSFLERLGVDLHPLAVLLDHLNADGLAVSAGFLAVSGPISSPSVTFYFSPDALSGSSFGEPRPEPQAATAPRLAHQRFRSVDGLITTGLKYLAKEQRPDGLWLDLDLDKSLEPHRPAIARGRSTQFVTAFVAEALLDVPEAQSLVAAAATALDQHGRAGQGWGWNEESPADAETTALAIRVLTCAGYSISEQCESVLRRHQRADGGFDAYLPALGTSNALDNADVTAAAVLALQSLAAAGGCDAQGGADAALHQLARTQQRGAWRSGSWASPLVATARAVQAFARQEICGQVRATPLMGQASQALLSWPLPDNPFLLAQWLRGWATVGGHSRWATVQRILISLDRQQQAGGQWRGAPNRCIPRVGPHACADEQELAIDWNGVITTASVISGLHALRELRAKEDHDDASGAFR
ncbi:prenyltransferase/squalene oxidase repeat-containing protein [Nonomuraea dietziae]|uniref:Squalene cyclase C-terminal domain-containing protein n=1 Tax=Nonomuraea dietziae TaxID=65515 RepID=A0A7W5YD18_9ACTN|nr:prenyltransferase/squalene oxidase repeat-containing protein [Nonomuraea dietziae]MBB3733788.1 hypothetical protein [Nonomuraea dietziae]